MLSKRTAVADVTDVELSLLQLLNPEVLADPWALYRALREHNPVHWDPYLHAWVVTGYSEAVTVLKYYSADRSPKPEYLEEIGLSFLKPFAEMMQQQMLFRSGAMHTRLRAICSSAFTPRRVEEFSSVIESVCDSLIDKVTPSGRADLIADFAAPFPGIVTARFFGVPEEDHHQLGIWTADLAEVLGNVQHDPERVTQIVRSLEDLKHYIAVQMEEQRRVPNTGLIHSLMTAQVDGNRLSDEEVIANTIVTLIGGHETTTNLIASGFLRLIGEPECLQQLLRNPEIIPSAVEELLRLESPVQNTVRIAPQEMQLGGKTILQGAKVVVVLAAANRDPSRFPEPDRMNLLRPDNRHLAFGWASHFCFGAPLARMEGKVAFRKLVSRISHPALIDQKPTWRGNAGLRGLTSLNIRFDAVPPSTVSA
jgi:pimeloyl-[acyl-carrier protein] synthase